MHGADARARENTCRTARSLSPTYYKVIEFQWHRTVPEMTHLVEEFWAFHADKVCARFVCDSFGQERLSASRRSPKKYTARRFYTDCVEKLGALDRLYDGHMQLFPRRMKGSYVGPGDIWNGGEAFPLGRGLDLLERQREIRGCDTQWSELCLR